MRMLLLLLGVTLAVAAVPTITSDVDKPAHHATTKLETEHSSTIKAKVDTKVDATVAKQPAKRTEQRQSKALKTSEPVAESRGKRTLYEYGNAGYLYSDVASKRAGYVDTSGAYFPQAGYYNEQNAVAHLPGSYGVGYAPYPQYLEAPEPIIEIIIKDANETLPEELPQPIISKKKKKEKVHVFYVNYKKDQNNKLHLESPIASLNNDDNDEEAEEEEESIVQYATPQPPLKTTTLRTIIHPDSEKYHSNSGIHVSFGAEDKRQTGHIIEENDAESIQRQVVALPVGNGVKSDGYIVNTRADYGRDNSNGHGFGHISGSNFYSQPQTTLQLQQQLPAQHSSTYFRPPAATQQFPKPPQQQQQQIYNKQYQTQPVRPNLTQQQLPSTSSQTIFNKLVQQSQYYINHNQQHQPHQPHQTHQSQQPQQQQQQQQPQYFKSPVSLPSKQVPFFPTIPPKTQSPYHPIKFRPTAAPTAQIKSVSAPAKFENGNYQQQTLKPLQPYQFTRQPQFVQQPHFTVRSPTSPSDYYAHQHHQHQQQQQQQEHHKYHGQTHSQTQTQTKGETFEGHTGLSGLHNYFDIKPSKETELLKSIPKFEQHITETVHNPISAAQHQQQQFLHSHSRNEVIHNIPAPNLSPTAQSQKLGGHYITATAQPPAKQQQFSSFANGQQSPVYAESTYGQTVMVVTPVPPVVGLATFNYNAHTNTDIASMQAQASNNFVQQPRQTATTSTISAAAATDNSPYSVSTHHSDVFKELEQRHKENQQGQQQHGPTGAKTLSSVKPPSSKATQTLSQLPDEVPEDLRQQLFSSGILNNADISVLDYDKVGDIALENLPADHLQHFYGAGGGAQIAETSKVLTVVKPNGDRVALSEKEIERVKQSNSLALKQNLDVKVVRFDAEKEQSVSNKYLHPDGTVVTPIDLADRQYNRYLPLKINGAQFPIPESKELMNKKIVSVVVLAPVEMQLLATRDASESRSVDAKEVKFLGGDLIKTLIKKPTKENFKRWLEKESRTDLDLQSVVLLVAKSNDEAYQEIFMYDIVNGSVNKLNGELSSTFVNVAEENASSEDLEHAATLDHSSLENMMQTRR